jgi:hypothetical protein
MILNKDVLVNNIITEISDNSNGQISPYDVRHNLLDIIDSAYLLIRGYPLDGTNFSTLNYRTTRVGENTLTTVGLAGHISSDNTAVGHSSLKSNFQGAQNTAVGSQSLFCNVYGDNNAAFGFSSLAGNTIGNGNVGFGNFALHNNKSGSFNIAIGHGAGYYINNQSNRLVIASHNINYDYICDNPNGSGLVPLVQGDLSNLKLGIAVSSLHNEGVLQVSGAISPEVTSLYNIGSPNYRWRSGYFSDALSFSSNQRFQRVNDSSLVLTSNLSISGGLNVLGNTTVSGDLLPSLHNTYDIGSLGNIWNYGYFNNIFVSGLATFNRLVAFEKCDFFCKTITLANSGSISLDGGGAESIYDYSHEPSPFTSDCGYLTDEQLYGAGFNIESSGNDYFRTYSFTFVPPDYSLTCTHSEDPYVLASWNSNISLHLSSGAHVKTDRVIFPTTINIVQQPECLGIFSRDNDLFVAYEDLVVQTEELAGIGDVNFYATSGEVSEYCLTLAAPRSGVLIKQRFLNNIIDKTTDELNNDLDNLDGFEIQYVNDANGLVYGPSANRLVVGSYNQTSYPVNVLSLMQSDEDEGVVCITNLAPVSQNVLPETTLNIRSANNAIARLTAENDAQTKSAIQLVGEINCLANAFEAEYLNGSGMANLNMYKDFVKTAYFRLYPNNTVGLFTGSGTSNAMLTIGDSVFNNAVISMRENTNTVTAASGYGKLYVSPKSAPRQSHTAYLMDGSGNRHDLVVNPLDVVDARGLYTDASGNTFGGRYCPDRRDDLTGIFRNTAIGSGACFLIASGAVDNVVLGASAASGITSGQRNVIIGSNTGRNIASSTDNVFIGSYIGSEINSSHNFLVGSSGLVLLQGKLGPTNSAKHLSMPSGGKFSVYDINNTNALSIKPNFIEVNDFSGNDYPQNNLTVSFIGNSSANLLVLNHASDPMTNNPTYQSPTQPRPYSQLNGDLKLRGAIRFSDNTSLDSAQFLDKIDQIDDIQSALSSLIVEGYTTSRIQAPSSPNNPTTGVLQIKNQNWVTTGEIILVNRDTTSEIHQGAYVIAIKINNQYRPIWISAKDTACECCNK